VRTLCLLGAAAAAVTLCGCSFLQPSTWYGERPACPLPEMTSAAVLPVYGAPLGHEERFGEILADELIQFPGIERVVRPKEAQFVLAAKNLDRYAVKDLRDLAKELAVDAILLAEPHESDLPAPPRAVVWCPLVLGRATAQGPDYALRLVRQGAMPPTAGGGAGGAGGVYSVERVYDAEAHGTSERLGDYAWRNETDVGGLERGDRVRKIGSSYFRFVSEQTIRDLFSILKEKAADDRSKDGERKFVYREG
jgi:hypothetical protein